MIVSKLEWLTDHFRSSQDDSASVIVCDKYFECHGLNETHSLNCLAIQTSSHNTEDGSYEGLYFSTFHLYNDCDSDVSCG